MAKIKSHKKPSFLWQALLIVLPNGLVKLINALPFICGDLRRQSLAEIWGNFQRAWQDPRSRCSTWGAPPQARTRRLLGSKASRMPSPIRLIDSTMISSVMPGK